MPIHPAPRPFPRGVRPHFFEAAERRRKLESDVFSILRSAGYREIILPVIDVAEPYREIVDEASRRRSYRFIDREGELLEIRSDFTPIVARALSPLIDGFELPLRISYRGDVVRCESSRLTNDGEFFQIGAELLGRDDPDGDAELLALAVAAARSGGADPTIVLSDERLVELMIEEVKPGVRMKLRRAIAERHLDEVERLAAGMAPATKRLLGSICSGMVDVAALNAAGLSDLLDAMVAARDSLRGVAVSFAFDDVEPEPSYYTGLRFKLYDRSSRVEIGRGGRYDELYGQFGKTVSAVGFTLSLDRLEELQ